MKVALVHDHLNQYGGAERVLGVLAEIFPRAPIFTLVYDKIGTRGVFENKEIYTSFLQHIPFTKKRHRIFPMLMPIAIEQFDFSYFDLVISNSGSFGKGIITKPSTKHISYCMTPTRFLWGGSHEYVDGFNYPWPVKKLIPFLTGYLRIWDLDASKRVDEFMAISETSQNRIKKYYKRNSIVVHPPVDVSKFYISDEIEDYFLMVGRMVPYKKFELAINTFNKLGLPLKIIGDGPEKKRLQRLAKDNIDFLGLLPDSKVAKYYSKAKALIFPQEEDFGIVPLEAMASGRPVIAFRKGGALETVINEKTGLFFDNQDADSLAKVISNFNVNRFDPKEIRAHAKKFDIRQFKEKFVNVINSLL